MANETERPMTIEAVRAALTDVKLIEAVAAGSPEYRGNGFYAMTPRDAEAMREVLLAALTSTGGSAPGTCETCRKIVSEVVERFHQKYETHNSLSQKQDQEVGVQHIAAATNYLNAIDVVQQIAKGYGVPPADALIASEGET